MAEAGKTGKVRKISFWQRVLIRASGPALSLLLHTAAVVSLVFLVKPQAHVVASPQTEITMVVEESVDLDSVLEEMPDHEPPLDDIYTMDDFVTSSRAPGLGDQESTDALAGDTLKGLDGPADDNPSGQALDVLANESPLKMRVLGADAGSLATLTERYGSRATRNGLLGSYFNSLDFTGETHMRIDDTLNKLWELDSPWPVSVRRDCFSVIWTGRIVPKRSGHYTFYLQSDDGARLWINGKVVVDQFTEHSRQVDTVNMTMIAGLSYDVKYAFCDVFQHAISQLEWSSTDAGVSRQLVPTDCLWADGASTRELIKWNEEGKKGGGSPFPNRDRVRNPALLEGVAFSHIVDYQNLNEDALTRLQLEKLVPVFRQYTKTHQLPAEFARPSGRDEAPSASAGLGSEDDVKVDLL